MVGSPSDMNSTTALQPEPGEPRAAHTASNAPMKLVPPLARRPRMKICIRSLLYLVAFKRVLRPPRGRASVLKAMTVA